MKPVCTAKAVMGLASLRTVAPLPKQNGTPHGMAVHFIKADFHYQSCWAGGVSCFSGVVELGVEVSSWWCGSGDLTDCTTTAWKPVVPPSGSVSGGWCNLFPHVIVSCRLLPECEIGVLRACPGFLLRLGTSVPSAEPSPALDLVAEAVVESNFRRSYAFLKLTIGLLWNFLVSVSVGLFHGKFLQERPLSPLPILAS